ncbi:aspartate/glutamate racemase family protein [Actinophytocola oryzae]|uniref:Asp/Glu/hydantoin racemase n=1 Tax=Actinophytocola oryzae TaxID=502181 RepID=A0A4R7VWD5_9PSEU|nr:aspartate/glutamate racemase family protein [Actinophytocola oryzae]TDV53958.1 hypothetical protein CLV71_104426 [Actinophytocola oryzae]
MTTYPRANPLPDTPVTAGIGVILSDTDAPRPPGDVGNPRTFPFPVSLTIATGADAVTLVEHEATGTLPHYVHSGQELTARGARAISTSCGFTVLHQQALADELDSIVATSALLQIPLLLRMLPARAELAVITANATTLTPRHLAAAGVDEAGQGRLHLVGLEHTPHLYPVLVTGTGSLDTAVATEEVVTAATTATAEHPGIAAFLLECANLPPYSPALRARTGLPVWDITSMLTWLQHGFAGPYDPTLTG